MAAILRRISRNKIVKTMKWRYWMIGIFEDDVESNINQVEVESTENETISQMQDDRERMLSVEREIAKVLYSI